MSDKVRFEGTCPHCDRDVDFIQGTLVSVGRMAVSSVISIKNDPVDAVQTGAEWLDREEGEVARCSHCDTNVIKCPQCGAVNDHSDDAALITCDFCDKKFCTP